MNKEQQIINKITLIERESWDQARNIIREKQSKKEAVEDNISGVVNKLLLKWKNDQQVEHYQQEHKNKKNARIEFTPEALEIYNSFAKGAKNYFINCFLRTWVKENS